MPCFDKDDIHYYHDDTNTKYCINDKNTIYSNTKINEVEFDKIYDKYDGNDYSETNNFGCDSLKKNIYNMTDKEWQCMDNNTEFQCHDMYYNNQLPIKKHNGEYDCISKNDTGNYYDNKILYNQLKNKLADNIV